MNAWFALYIIQSQKMLKKIINNAKKKKTEKNS